jgi:hypothetical protein
MYGAGAPLRAIAQKLGRSEDAVAGRRRALRLRVRRASRPWSELEEAFLRIATEEGLPAAAVARRLQRPVESVRLRRRQLGLSRPAARHYSADDDTMLRARWSAGTDIEALARELGRSPDAVRLHARRLGLHHPPARRRWTSAEDASVRDGYGDGLRCEEIAAALPGRSATAVAARARKLGLATYARRWTREDDARLPGLLEIRSLEAAARVLGRTPEAVRRRASKLALALPAGMVTMRSGEPWTVAEDELLKLHAAVNPSVLAGLLGRSDRAVVSRLRHLGLRAGRWRSPHHPVPTNGELTPGERALVERELQVRGSRALLSLEQRLERPLGQVSASQRRPARRS